MGIPIGNKQWKLRRLKNSTNSYAEPSSYSIPLCVVIAGVDTPNEYISVGSGRYKIVALFNESDAGSSKGFNQIAVLAGNTPEDLKQVLYIIPTPSGFENVINNYTFRITKVVYNKLTNQFLLFFVNGAASSSNSFFIFKSSNLTSFTQLKLNTSSSVSNFYNYRAGSNYVYQNYFYYNNQLIDRANEPAVNKNYASNHVILLNSKVNNAYDLLFLYNDAQYLVSSSSGSYMKITDTFVPAYTAGYTGCLYNPIRNELIFASPKEICQIALTDILNFNTKVKRTTLSGNVMINSIIQNGSYIYGAIFTQYGNYKSFESKNGGNTWTDYTSNYTKSILLSGYGEYNYTAPRKIDGKWITTQGDNDRFMQSKCHSLDFNSAQDQIIFNMGDSDAASIKFNMSIGRAYQYGLIYSPYQKSYFYLLGGCGTAGFGILYAHDSYVSSVSVSPNGTKITALGTDSISKSVTWRISSLNHNKRKRKIA